MQSITSFHRNDWILHYALASFRMTCFFLAASPSAPRDDVETERKYVLDQPYVYILFSRKNGTLYVGVTSDLIKRIYEHKNKIKVGYAERFNINKLGYYEIFQDITLAIKREKQLKSGSKQKKLDLINSMNPE